jgi:hypothetical protein
MCTSITALVASNNAALRVLPGRVLCIMPEVARPAMLQTFKPCKTKTLDRRQTRPPLQGPWFIVYRSSIPERP